MLSASSLMPKYHFQQRTGPNVVDGEEGADFPDVEFRETAGPAGPTSLFIVTKRPDPR